MAASHARMSRGTHGVESNGLYGPRWSLPGLRNPFGSSSQSAIYRSWPFSAWQASTRRYSGAVDTVLVLILASVIFCL